MDKEKAQIWTKMDYGIKLNINVNRNTPLSRINQGDLFINMVPFWNLTTLDYLSFI